MSSPDEDLTFERGAGPLVGVVTLVGVMVVISPAGRRLLLAPDLPAHVEIVWETPFFLLLALGTWLVLRYDGVTLDGVGLGRSELGPAVSVFVVFWLWVTLVGVGYLAWTGGTGELGYPFDVEWYWFLVWLSLTVLANGLVEEFVVRGYMQSKCIALWSSYPRVPAVAVGVVSASVLFGLAHVPTNLIVVQTSPGAIPEIVLVNFIPGLVFGSIYYLTQNVWFVGFVHGFANVWPVPFATTAVPFFTNIAALSALLLAVVYWYWGKRTDRVTVDVEKRVATDQST